MKTPDFFIVGAPKCGTSSFHEYLEAHPDIHLAKGEPHYFGTDVDFHHPYRLSREQYLQLFSDAGGARVLGDKSVYYLFSKRAAREIRDFNPGAKILIFLRNPVDMLYSLHAQYYMRAGFENIRNFEAALDAEQDRREGRKMPNKVRFPEALYYSEIVRYSEQVSRYFDVFPKEQIHIVII